MRYRYLPILLILSIIAIVIHSGFGPFSLSLVNPDSLSISAEEARRHRFSFIFDLRTQRDREENGFYPNSIPISVETIKQEVPFLLGQKPSDQRIRSTPILVYSHSNDGRARLAAETLYDMGFVGTRYLSGSYLQMMPPGPLS
jgi:rhodanese-related sulfurtransferase